MRGVLIDKGKEKPLILIAAASRVPPAVFAPLPPFVGVPLPLVSFVLLLLVFALPRDGYAPLLLDVALLSSSSRCWAIMNGLYEESYF